MEWQILSVHSHDLGLTLAPTVWQYVTERVCDFFRSLGFIVTVYLDNFLLIADSKEGCQAQLDREFKALGLKVNLAQLIALTQVCRWLGLDINSVNMQILVPPYKLERIKTELRDFRQQSAASGSVALADLLSLVGRLSHVSRAVRSSRTFLRRMWDTTRALPRRVLPLPTFRFALTRAFWEDFEWWEAFLFRWNGVSRGTQPADSLVFSDACLSGFGFHSGPDFRFGAWPADLHREHINWLELRALELAAWHFAARWTGLRILFVCDNLAVIGIITVGASSNCGSLLFSAVSCFCPLSSTSSSALFIYLAQRTLGLTVSLACSVLAPPRCAGLSQTSSQRSPAPSSPLLTHTRCVALADANSPSALYASHISAKSARELHERLLQQVHSLVPSAKHCFSSEQIRVDPSGRAFLLYLAYYTSRLHRDSPVQPSSVPQASTATRSNLAPQSTGSSSRSTRR